MKRLLLILLVPLFAVAQLGAVGVRADAFFGSASGFDVAAVFGDGMWRHSAGLLYSSAEFNGVRNHVFVPGYYDEYGTYIRASYQDNYYREAHSNQIYPYYQLDFCPTFFTQGKVGIGMDLGVLFGWGYDSASTVYMSMVLGIVPQVQVTVGNFDIVLGYRGVASLLSIVEYDNIWKNSFTFGVTYRIGTRNVVQTTTSGDIRTGGGGDTGGVYILPGSSIKRIY